MLPVRLNSMCPTFLLKIVFCPGWPQTPYVAEDGFEFQTLTTLPPGVNGTMLLPYQVSALPAEYSLRFCPIKYFVYVCLCAVVHRGQTVPSLLGLALQAVFETPGVGVEMESKSQSLERAVSTFNHWREAEQPPP